MGSTSPPSVKSNPSKTAVERDLDWPTKPEFIYGGPFIQPPTQSPFLDTATPINIQLQGTFKKSYAYYSLTERLPIILTKVIDYCSRESAKITSSTGATDGDVRSFIQYVTKLKNDLVTNKKYDLFTVDTPDARKWNLWIEAQEQQKYFTNAWVFSECYVYRRLREGCELAGNLKNFDPFREQKDKSFTDHLEPMCIVAEKLISMLPPSEKDKRKADFVTLIKLCLWSNKCDLSLSAGSAVNLMGGKEGSERNAPVADPFQMIIDFKDKLLVDDSGKIADGIVKRSEAAQKAITGPPEPESSPSPAAAPAIDSAEPQEPPPEPAKIPCPAKMTIPQTVNFDIICDNAGYEVFTDLCLAHFLISQELVQKIRFHLKQFGWFVSDVTERDFKHVIDSCAKATYSRTVESEPKTGCLEGMAGGGIQSGRADGTPEAAEPRVISAESLRALGEQWNRYLEDGTFVIMAEDYWTWPHVYRDMKRIDYNLYRKLQYTCALMFKGDLNYRKLLGERNTNPYLGFEAALQGFLPAPVIAVRTVKAELICGLPKGKFDVVSKIDPKWMQKGDYGVIQFCAKAEPLKPSAEPCIDYGKTCFSGTCPVHTDM